MIQTILGTKELFVSESGMNKYYIFVCYFILNFLYFTKQKYLIGKYSDLKFVLRMKKYSSRNLWISLSSLLVPLLSQILTLTSCCWDAICKSGSSSHSYRFTVFSTLIAHMLQILMLLWMAIAIS